MGNGYQPPSQGDFGWLADAMRDVERRLAELETPTGTSVNSVAAQAVELARLAVLPFAIYQLDSPLVSSSISEFAKVMTPVPAGYTRALVSITAGAALKSGEATGSWSLITVSAGIQGTARNTTRTSVSGQMYGSATAAGSAVLTDLEPGSTVDVSAFASFPGAYSVPSVSVSGSILFLR